MYTERILLVYQLKPGTCLKFKVSSGDLLSTYRTLKGVYGTFRRIVGLSYRLGSGLPGSGSLRGKRFKGKVGAKRDYNDLV